MLKRLLLVAVLCIAGSHAFAQCAPLPYTLTNGTIADANQVMANFNAVNTCAQGSLPTQPTNTAMAALLTSSLPNKAVIRLGFAGAGDAPALVFLTENGTCAANSRINDGGSCVNTTSGDGNSFYALYGDMIYPAEFGAAGNGSTNDQAALQAAINYAQVSGKIVWLGDRLYAISSGLTISAAVQLKGNNARPWAGWPPTGAAAPCTTGIRVATANLAAAIAVTQSAPGVVIDSLCIDNKNISNTSGATITAIANSGTNMYGFTLSNSEIIGCFICLDLSGTGAATQNIGSHIEGDAFIVNDVAGSIGMRVGHNDAGGTNNAITTEVFLARSEVYCNGAISTNSTGFRIEDGGGVYMRNSNTVACNLGLVILPGANQSVTGGIVADSAFDSDHTNDLYIDLGASTSMVGNMQFTSDWFASAQGFPVLLQNAGNGTMAGINFVANRIYPRVNTDGVHIGAMAGAIGTDLTFYSNKICWVGTGASTGTAFSLLNTASVGMQVQVVGNMIGACDTNGVSGSMATGLSLAGAGAEVQIASNIFNSTTTPISLGGTTNIMQGTNAGIDDQPITTLASAATVTVTPNTPLVAISGTTTITTITPAWGGRRITIVPIGAWSTGGGGNIGTTFTASPGKVVTGVFTGSNWNFGGY